MKKIFKNTKVLAVSYGLMGVGALSWFSGTGIMNGFGGHWY